VCLILTYPNQSNVNTQQSLWLGHEDSVFTKNNNFKTVLDYNTLEEELEVVKRVAISGFEQVEQVADIADIADIRQQFEKIHVDDGCASGN
jgi:hypothetical protein